MDKNYSRKEAKRILGELIPNSAIDTDELIDCIIEAVIKHLLDNYQIDVPNTGYYGIIVKKEE